MSLNLRLTKPLIAKGKTLTELELRNPCARDFFDLGLPMVVFTLDDQFKGFEFRMKVLALFIGRLAGIQPEQVKEMAMSDIGRCQTFVLSFLGHFAKGDKHV